LLAGPEAGKEALPSVVAANLVIVPTRPAHRENDADANAPATRGVVAEHPEHDGYVGTTIEDLRRRRARRRALFVLVCLLLVALAFVPVADQLILPATVVAFGEEAIVDSPAAGVVKQVLVRVGDTVKRGDRLALIEPPISASLIDERRNWNLLKMQEARLGAHIAGQARFSRPEGLFNADGGADIESMLLEQERRLAQDLREDRATLEPLDQSIQRHEKERAEAEAGKAAIEKQLSATQARQREAAALKDRHVVYDDGVYTEQLIGTLAQLARGLRGHMAKQEQAVAAAEVNLIAAQDALAQRRLQRASELEAALARVRDQLADSTSRLAAITERQSLIEVSSPRPGTVQQLHVQSADAQVQAGERLLTLLVPGERAVLEALIPAYDRERIQVGQSASVTFPYPGNDQRVEYAGVVRAVAPSQGQLAYVQVEIDTPREGANGYRDFASGLRGEVVLASREEALRRHLWRWLRRQAESFDAQAFAKGVRTLVDRAAAVIYAPPPVPASGDEQGP